MDMKTLKYFFWLLIAMTSVSFISCSDDDVEEVIATSIVGEWYRESDTQSITYTFNSDLKGNYLEINKDEYGEETTRRSENFEYSLSENSNGEKFITMVFESTSRKLEYELTASKLLLYTTSTSYQEFKRRK